jgi:hypothetical protein
MSQTNQSDHSDYSVLNLLARRYWFIFGYFFTLFSIKEILFLKARFFPSEIFCIGFPLSFSSVCALLMRNSSMEIMPDGNPATIKDFFQYCG